MASFSGLPSKATKRGYSTCPACKLSYPARKKPKVCECGRELGGSFTEPSTKNILPGCVLVSSTNGSQGSGFELFSCLTSGRDTRTFVLQGNNAHDKLCYQPKCKELRSSMSASGKLSDFKCKHLDLVKERIDPIFSISFSDREIDDFSPDNNIREKMKNFQRQDMPTVVKLSSRSYAVMGEESTTNPMGYVHETINDVKKILQCNTDTCRNRHERLKHGGQYQICVHVHYTLLARKLKEDIFPRSSQSVASNVPSSTPENPTVENQSYQLSWQDDLEGTSLQRSSTLKLQMKRKLPSTIPCEIVRRGAQIATTHGLYFEPRHQQCLLCNSSLCEASFPKGSSCKEGNGILLTHQMPFEKCTMKVKICQNQECMAVNHVFPYDEGLFNVCNKIIVELAILLGWRESLKKGVPVSHFIEITLNTLLLTVEKEDQPSKTELNYFSQLLYNGFYGFEALTDRNLDDVICGICGIVGELYLGDGNEKNCCSLREVDMTAKGDSLPVSENSNHLESILTKIKLRLVEQCCFANSKLPFKIRINQVPPIIPPASRKFELNTETEKRSTYLTKKTDGQEGDPILLAQIFKERQISLASLDGMDKETLLEIARYCKVKTASKSMEMLRFDLRALYATILVGTSPCHGFNSSPGHTGGFYHLVCRHSCTVASKFMLLSESVRDAADLYLSLKCPPITFVYDTACTFVRHLNNREPHKTSKFWGNFDGCFEIPSLDREPNAMMNVPQLVPSEFLASNRKYSSKGKLDEDTHPISLTPRRFVLGDRFHTTVKPHKSPLCLYHNINNCAQANTLKTSYQEAENGRKNKKRLRSACNQNFHHHYFYNFLMDYYQNEKIVMKQRESLEASSGMKPQRDEYMRFVV